MESQACCSCQSASPEDPQDLSLQHCQPASRAMQAAKHRSPCPWRLLQLHPTRTAPSRATETGAPMHAQFLIAFVQTSFPLPGELQGKVLHQRPNNGSACILALEIWNCAEGHVIVLRMSPSLNSSVGVDSQSSPRVQVAQITAHQQDGSRGMTGRTPGSVHEFLPESWKSGASPRKP